MTLTRQQEQDLAPVVYEWNMLVAAAERVRSAVDSGDQLLTNLLLEAFVVHFRQLGNFFFASPEKGRPARRPFCRWPIMEGCDGSKESVR
jgi:hypothetical protein